MAGLSDAAHRLYLGDARDLSILADESVHLVVTSPPYWQIKDYGSEGQIGFHQSFPEYIESLNLVWTECCRALAPGCRMCVNVGDQFSRSIQYGRYKVVSIQSEIIRHCETIGVDYMGTIIWKKVTTTNTTGGASIMGSFPFPRNGMVKINYEHILLFKKPGAAPKPSPAEKEASRLSIEDWNAYFSGIWSIPGVRQKAHSAMFPEEIPRRLIRMYSFQGETVLDPFAGSGTTMAVAAELGRSSAGIEIDPRCAELVCARFEGKAAKVQILGGK
jgi:site-specific DNA-methyltransferase (adenine-specific)